MATKLAFCITKGKICVAPQDDAAFSYLGWCHEDEDTFFKHVVLGSYVSSQNALYCFREMDFSADDMPQDKARDVEILAIVEQHIFKLREVLGLVPETKVFIGQEGSAKLVGTVGDLLKRMKQADERGIDFSK